MITKKALALLSGGLDSTLAIKIILEQGIKIEAINFLTVFCNCTKKSSCCLEARKVATKFGIKLKILNVSKDYLELIKNPKFGYGRGMNPCLDCRIFMFKKAKEYMKEIGASFLITGEVLGERPMSQKREAIRLIEKEAGLEGLILRPLSAKLFTPTIAEEIGIIDREKLFAISGRSRKEQIAIADKYNIVDYPCPAGGCLLTDKEFSNRMRDLIKYGELSLNEVQLLKLGRHFRLSKSYKIIVGRNKQENKKLFMLAKEGDILFKAVNFTGPITIGRGVIAANEIEIASSITAKYSNGKKMSKVDISYKKLEEDNEKIISVSPLSDLEISKLRIQEKLGEKESNFMEYARGD